MKTIIERQSGIISLIIFLMIVAIPILLGEVARYGWDFWNWNWIN